MKTRENQIRTWLVKLVELLPFAFYVTLIPLLVSRLVAGDESISIVLFEKAFGISGWYVIGAFMIAAFVSIAFWLPWHIRAMSLLPAFAYSILLVGMFLKGDAASSTTLFAVHLYGFTSITLFTLIASLNAAEIIRGQCEEEAVLLKEIRRERSKLRSIKQELRVISNGASLADRVRINF